MKREKGRRAEYGKEEVTRKEERGNEKEIGRGGSQGRKVCKIKKTKGWIRKENEESKREGEEEGSAWIGRRM